MSLTITKIIKAQKAYNRHSKVCGGSIKLQDRLLEPSSKYIITINKLNDENVQK